MEERQDVTVGMAAVSSEGDEGDEVAALQRQVARVSKRLDDVEEANAQLLDLLMDFSAAVLRIRSAFARAESARAAS